MAQVFDTLVKIQQIVSSYPVSLSLKNTKGQYFFVNDVWLEIFKLKKEDVIGKTDYDILPKQLADLAAKADKETCRSSKVIKYQNSYSYNDKETNFTALKCGVGDSFGNLFCICTLEDRIENQHLMIELDSKLTALLVTEE